MSMYNYDLGFWVGYFIMKPVYQNLLEFHNNGNFCEAFLFYQL